MVLSTEVFTILLSAALTIYNFGVIDPNLLPKDTPQEDLEEAYDFIIVGAGSAGCVLANRLSEKPEWTVCIIEAGGNETAVSRTPLLWTTLQNTDLDWNFTTVPQRKACRVNNGVCDYAQGRVMGGSSSTGALTWVRGNRKDYDEWEELGNPGWNYKEVLKYFRKVENVTEPDLVSSPYRGTKGPQNIQYPLYNSRLREAYMKAGEELGWTRRDYNGPIQEDAIGYVQITADGPTRESASSAYLSPIRRRKNLTIIQRSFVIKIIIKNKRAIGVKYIRNGKTYTVNANKEVILSAGAINTPKLLMLSGIGPETELEKHGIEVLIDLPVGARLQDHPGTSVFFEINENIAPFDIWKTNKTILQFAKSRKGPLTSTSREVVSFTNPDVPAGLPTIMFGMSNTLSINGYGEPDKQIANIYAQLLYPKSVGSVKLRSSDPFDDPLIDPKFFAVREDYEMMVKGIKIIFDLLNTSALKKFRPKQYTGNQERCTGLARRNFINCLIKEYSNSYNHPVGTAKMGPSDDAEAVVDSNLCVLGTFNLRVIDASIMPVIPRGQMNAVAMMIGEKGADMIKSKYSSMGRDDDR